ncbi:MAG: chorismate mutase [Mogibacterium sp.]|nr:chorismate mutase [Mogibacterium sp.]
MLQQYREQIDKINEELIRLLEERMHVSEQIAEYKAANGMRIVDPVREHQLLEEVTETSDPEFAYYNRMIFSTLMEMSADHQRKVTGQEPGIVEEIRSALSNTAHIFPEYATVACQGVQGAYSQEAAEKFFKMPKIVFTKNFRGVFAAVQSGLCRYGVLPIENSTAGSVNQVYDLLAEYDFHIVKSIRIRIDHCLLVNAGVRREEVREILSHEQALAQCEEYLRREFPAAKIVACENTAEAARQVAASGRRDLAALGSAVNGRVYGLDCLEKSVQDSDNNYTRFICITKPLEIYPGANKTSFLCVTNHTPGSLYRVLACFNSLGINILKLESRPIPGSDFDFRFYFDIEESVYTEQFVRAMSQISDHCKEFRYFGSYIEL